MSLLELMNGEIDFTELSTATLVQTLRSLKDEMNRAVKDGRIITFTTLAKNLDPLERELYIRELTYELWQ